MYLFMLWYEEHNVSLWEILESIIKWNYMEDSSTSNRRYSLKYLSNVDIVLWSCNQGCLIFAWQMTCVGVDWAYWMIFLIKGPNNVSTSLRDPSGPKEEDLSLTVSPSVDVHIKMMHWDKVICPPASTPLTVTNPPTLWLCNALPNTTHLARWGSLGWWILFFKKGWGGCIGGVGRGEGDAYFLSPASY